MHLLNWRARGAINLAAVACVLAAGCSKQPSNNGSLPTLYMVSGTVSGAVSASVEVSIQGGTRRTFTDSTGRWEITGLPNGTYTVEASLNGYTFLPATRTAVVNGASVTGLDFTSVKGNSIAGVVAGDASGGVTVTLMGPEPATSTQTVTTDASGSFLFENVGSGTFLVTPSLASGWTFVPANTVVTMAGSSVTGLSFDAIAPTHPLSGTVTGAFTSGVVITLSGDADGIAITDGSGNYTFAALAPGKYVVTPSYPGYIFEPAEIATTVGASAVTGVNFLSAATHTIAGRITGAVIAGVGVEISGAAIGVTFTDASGYFAFPGLPDGTYFVAPALEGYAFAPAVKGIPLAGASVTNVNFTASANAVAHTPSVSGLVSGAPAGVTMMLEGDPTIVATTDATGAFTFADVPTGAYLLVPSLIDYTFNPASWLIDVSTADVTGLDFTAALNPTARIISGNVTGAATAGVTVTLAGPTSGTTTSDAAGNFAFDGLGDGTYLVTPSLAGFVFTPSDCLVTVAGPSVTSVEFTSVVTPHSISGTVSPATAGVSVVLFMDAQTSGTTAAADAQVVTSTTTAADGSYTFTGLENGSFVVVPALWGYYFSPAGAAVTLAGADVAGVDFIIAPSHVISGHVSGDVISGVAVNLSGAANGKATTDVTGYYAFGDLPNGNYVLTPSAAGYSFAPQFLATSLSGADLTTANFTSTLVPVYSVTGKVSGVTVSGVTVTLSDPASIATTDGTGTYTFSGLPNGSYLVIPSARGDAFTPASRAFRINGASVTGQDFTSAVAP